VEWAFACGSKVLYDSLLPVFRPVGEKPATIKMELPLLRLLWVAYFRGE
jgi:hypothetical protein